MDTLIIAIFTSTVFREPRTNWRGFWIQDTHALNGAWYQVPPNTSPKLLGDFAPENWGHVTRGNFFHPSHLSCSPTNSLARIQYQTITSTSNISQKSLSSIIQPSIIHKKKHIMEYGNLSILFSPAPTHAAFHDDSAHFGGAWPNVPERRGCQGFMVGSLSKMTLIILIQWKRLKAKHQKSIKSKNCSQQEKRMVLLLAVRSWILTSRFSGPCSYKLHFPVWADGGHSCVAPVIKIFPPQNKTESLTQFRPVFLQIPPLRFVFWKPKGQWIERTWRSD